MSGGRRFRVANCDLRRRARPVVQYQDTSALASSAWSDILCIGTLAGRSTACASLERYGVNQPGISAYPQFVINTPRRQRKPRRISQLGGLVMSVVPIGFVELSVPPDAAGHAKTHGAIRDEQTGLWIAPEPLNGELENYRVGTKGQNDSFYEYVPRCPRCRQTMVKNTNRAHDAWWVCPECSYRMSYEQYLDGYDNKSRLPAKGASARNRSGETSVAERKQERIVRMAITMAFNGNSRTENRWRDAPSHKYWGASPNQLLAEGNYAAVLDLLDINLRARRTS